MMICWELCSFFGKRIVGSKGSQELRISTLIVKGSVETAINGGERGVEKINTDVDLLNSASFELRNAGGLEANLYNASRQ
jgi:hypothetical protein